jgi:hypothetical protein
MADRNLIFTVERDGDLSNGELWMGGVPFDDAELKTFDLIVNASNLEPLREGEHGREMLYGTVPAVIDVEFDDGPLSEETANLVDTAAEVAAGAVLRGDRVLVHCAQGWNRSGVIVARALVWMGACNIEQAIAIIRSLRSPHALSNPSFTAWLMRKGPNTIQNYLMQAESAARQMDELRQSTLHTEKCSSNVPGLGDTCDCGAW